MRVGVATLAFALAASLAFAEGGGTVAKPDKPKPEPQGNPNRAEPGLEDQGWKAYETTYVPVLKDWNIKTFHGGYAAVTSKDGGQIMALPVKGKPGVSVKAEEFAIEVDGNGDGKYDERLKTDGAACLVGVVYEDGTMAPYAVRFQKGKGGAWSWQRSGYWTATVNKVPIGILDNNNNGKYDENGQDAVSVGLTGYASPLSAVVNLGGTLYELKVAENGKKVYVKEYAGETGKLDALSGHKSLGRLTSAIFQNGQTWIDAAYGKDKAVVVPTGSWEFLGGECKSATQSALMKKGNMQPVSVTKDETTKVAWGMDCKIDFDFDLNGSTVSIQVTSVHVYGASGEEYHTFAPPTFTPVVTVWNSKTGEQAQKGKMALC
ncbi:MAG: hypothetical protein HYY18_05075 [Planctomycetes bacterium]|nr:hypothetical protein [Planctomycetota bacterium]